MIDLYRFSREYFLKPLVTKQMSSPVQGKEWLGLGEAAKFLGIHPVTLRRWADAGEIGYMLTAGGHRRFALADVRRFAAGRQRLGAVPNSEQAWADRAMVHSREVIQAHRHAPWMKAFGEEERERSRALGRRLMAIVLQYVSCDENSDILLREACAIGEQYALSAIAHDLTLTVALEATMSFRDAMFEAAILVPEMAHTASNNAHLLKRINTLINAVQLAVASAYDNPDK